MKQKVIAIVPSAGSGTRFGEEINKAFYEILGKPVVLWVLETFQSSALIDEIIPVFSETDMERGLALIEQYEISKVKKIAPGGRERQESVANALKLIDGKSPFILIHDGVRPVIDMEIVKRCLKALEKYDGVVAAVEVKDTIKKVKGDIVEHTLDRSRLMAIQTPQAFKYKTILQAFEKVKGDDPSFTDDAAVVEHAGGTVGIVEGSYRNIKVTTPDDAVVVEAFLKERERT